MITITGKVFENVFTAAQWATQNPVLADRVQGFDSTNKAFKIGDGVTAWNSLAYYYPVSALLPDVISIPIGSTMTGDFFIVNYATYSGHGNNPRLELDLVIDSDTVEIQFTGIRKIYYGGILIQIALFLSQSGGVTDQAYKLIIG